MKTLIPSLLCFFLIISCNCEDELIEPQFGKFTLNLVKSDLKNSGNKQEFSDFRTEAVDEAYRDCSMEEITSRFYGPETGLYYVAELVDEGKTVGHRMYIANPTEEFLLNVKVTSAIYGEIFSMNTINYPEKIWFTVPEACDELTLEFEGYAPKNLFQTKTKRNWVKLEVCDYKAPDCEFPEIMYSLEEINSDFNLDYYVRFYQNDELMYSFEYNPPGPKEIELAYGTYDVFIEPLHYYNVETPDLKGNKLGIKIEKGSEMKIQIMNKSAIVYTSSLNLQLEIPWERDWVPNWFWVENEKYFYEYHKSLTQEGAFPPLYTPGTSISASVKFRPWDYPYGLTYSINDPEPNKIYKIMLCGIAKPEFKVEVSDYPYQPQIMEIIAE